jgi:ribosomal protein S8E
MRPTWLIMMMTSYLKECKAMRLMKLMRPMLMNMVMMMRSNLNGDSVEYGTETKTEPEEHGNEAENLTSGNEIDESTKEAEEVAVRSEVTKIRAEEYDSESTLSRGAKMEISSREALLSQVHQAIKVKSMLGTNFKDPLQKDDIARLEDSKTQKKAFVKVEDVF